MNDIIRTIKSLEDSGLLIDEVTEIVKHKIKKTRRWISWSFISAFSHFYCAKSNFSCSKGISERGIRRAGRGYMDKNLKFCSIL